MYLNILRCKQLGENLKLNYTEVPRKLSKQKDMYCVNFKQNIDFDNIEKVTIVYYMARQ